MKRKEPLLLREANYDLLRIISTIAVIILHVSAIFLNAITDYTMSDMNKKTFQRLCLISLAITTISGWTSSFELNWSVSKAICYIGYIMIGYQVRTYFIQKKNNKKAIVYLLLGIALEVLLAYIRFSCDGGKPGIDEKYAVVGNFNPLIVLSSVLIFMGVSQMELKTKKLKKIASNTFLIYLFHAGVITVLSPVIKWLDRMWFDCRIIIPVFVVIVFVVSLILANLYQYLHHCWRIKSIQ